MANSEFTQPTKEQIDQFWSEVAIPRSSKLEFNFKEKAVTIGAINDGGSTCFIQDDAWIKSVLPLLEPLWHDEGRDELEYLILYSDNTFLCQKRRLKYDFSSKSSYWITYEFNECETQQIIDLCDCLVTIATIQKEVEKNKILQQIRELNSLDFFYDSKWYKKKDEINKMLLFSDWRVLPDATQKFEGEQDLWIIWRQKLRELMPSNPREIFATNFEMFKFISTLRYPIDPRVYIDKYPNREVEYLSTDDQYCKYDFEVSKDFTSANLLSLVIYLETYDENMRPIASKVLELSKKLQLEKTYQDLDYNKFFEI